MTLLVWIIVGALAGWLASLVTGDDRRMGALGNIIVGIIGSFVAGILVTLFTKGDADFTTTISGFDLTSVVLSTLGAIILIAIMRTFRTSPI